jgi:hypothetical protein
VPAAALPVSRSMSLAYTFNSLVEDRMLWQERICTTFSPFGDILPLASSTCEVIFIFSLESLGGNPTCSNRFGPQTGVLVTTN